MRVLYNIELAALYIVFCNLLVIFGSFFGFGIVVFQEGESDGFYRQIMMVIGHAEHVLSGVHYLRYIVISPFVYVEEICGSLGVTLLLINIYVFTIVSFWKSVNYQSIFSILLLFIPYLFSVRTSLCIISIFIAYTSLFNRNRINICGLIISCLFANLSSGVLLNILALCCYKLYKYNKKLIILFFPFSLLILLPMLISKLDFFSGSNPIFSMIMRNNIISSFGVDYVKFYFYIMVFSIYLFSSLWFFHRNGLFFIFSLLGLLSLVLFEGLGAISMLGVIIFYLLSRFKFSHEEIMVNKIK